MQHEDSRSNEPYQCSCGRAFAEVPMDVDSLGTDKGLHLHKVPAVYYQEYMLRICITSAYMYLHVRCFEPILLCMHPVFMKNDATVCFCYRGPWPFQIGKAGCSRMTFSQSE